MERLKNIFTFSRSYNFKDNFRNYLRVIFIWCPVVSILFICGFGGFDNLPRRLAISLVISCTVATFCFMGAWFISYLLNLYRANKGLAPKKQGLFFGVLISYLFLVPGLHFGLLLAVKFSEVIGYSYSAPSFKDYSSGIIFGIMVSGLFTLFEVIRESKAEKQAADLRYRTLENEKLKAQVSALTAQMNPHLLFNSLNTIASTITSNPKSAEDMVVQLSELYRGILKSAKGEVHTLESELLLCQSYLEIEQKRFGPRVEYKIFVEASLDPKKITIPVLLLQPLVENAIKHGLTPKREGGKVWIEVRKEGEYFKVDVSDDGIGIGHNKSSVGTGTGLANCESRIKLKYGESSKFSFTRSEENKTIAAISIPLRAVVCD